MINQVIAKDLKGLNFRQDIGPLTLLLGPNGSGKSARHQALTLALLGYIPGGGKTNADILDSYGSADTLIVGAKISDTLFERGFVRKDGKVSQGYKINGKAVKSDDFAKRLGAMGAPVPIDITAFMALSDAKKIDVIMGLYPPESDITKLLTDIEAKKKLVNDLTAKVKQVEGAAAQLTNSRAAMQLPPGTLADTEAHIKETEVQLAQARQDLQEAEVEEAKVKAAEEERNKLEVQKAGLPGLDLQEAKEAEEKKGAPQEPTSKEIFLSRPPTSMESTPVQLEGPDIDAQLGHAGVKHFCLSSPDGQEAARIVMNDAAASLQTVLDALKKAGCGTCAARLVAMKELRKYKPERREAAA